MSEAGLLRVELGERSYPIHIGTGLLGDAALYAPFVNGRLAAVVTNETVAPLYAQALEGALAAAGARTLRIVLRDGEAFKDWKSLDAIFARLLEAQADRRTVLVAPSLSPRMTALPASTAASRALSATSVTMALSFGLMRSMADRWASRISTGVISRDLTSAASSPADFRVRLAFGI